MLKLGVGWPNKGAAMNDLGHWLNDLGLDERVKLFAENDVD